MRRLVAAAAAAYPQLLRDAKIDLGETAATWHQSIELTGGTQVPYRCFEKALAIHIQNVKWFPTLAELIEKARGFWQEERPRLEAAPEPCGEIIPPDELTSMAREMTRKMRMG